MKHTYTWVSPLGHPEKKMGNLDIDEGGMHVPEEYEGNNLDGNK